MGKTVYMVADRGEGVAIEVYRDTMEPVDAE